MLSPVITACSPINTSQQTDERYARCFARPTARKTEGISVSPYVFVSPRTLREVSVVGSSWSKNVMSYVFSDTKRDKSHSPLKTRIEQIKCVVPNGDNNDSIATYQSLLSGEIKSLRGFPSFKVLENRQNIIICYDKTISTKRIHNLIEIPNSGLRFRDYAKIVINKMVDSSVKMKPVHSSNDVNLKSRRKSKSKKTRIKKPTINNIKPNQF